MVLHMQKGIKHNLRSRKSKFQPNVHTFCDDVYMGLTPQEVKDHSRVSINLDSWVSFSKPLSSTIFKFSRFLTSKGGHSVKTGRLIMWGFRRSLYRPKLIRFSREPLNPHLVYTQGPATRVSKAGRSGSLYHCGPLSTFFREAVSSGGVGTLTLLEDAWLGVDYRRLFKHTPPSFRALYDWGNFTKLGLLVTPGGLRIAYALKTYCYLVAAIDNYAVLFTPSGALLLVPSSSTAYSQVVTKISTNGSFIPKLANQRAARLMLLRGSRPKVRGVAKNSCDHPHGGNTKGILRPRSP